MTYRHEHRGALSCIGRHFILDECIRKLFSYPTNCVLGRDGLRGWSAEMRRLLVVAGPRQVVYLTAVHTGIRRGELAELVWGDLFFDRPTRYVRVRASTAKNHRDAIICLCDELAALLQAIKPVSAASCDRVFDTVPSMPQFRADLHAAGIEYRNQQGQLADFHALRHTFITNMARGGVAPRVAMELARHSEMNLTMNVYTTTNLLPTAAAVQKLPHYCEALPQILPHGTGADVLLLAHVGTEAQSRDIDLEPVNIGESHVLAETGAVGHERELVGPLGFEPRTKGL